jgi:hypothetical protein
MNRYSGYSLLYSSVIFIFIPAHISPIPFIHIEFYSITFSITSISSMERSTQRELFYTGVSVDTDVGRVCDSCSQPMHHFCSHDIAELEGLTDFGEKCYCSTNCYNEQNTINTAPRVTTPSIHNIDLVLNGSVDMRPIKTCAVCGEYNSCDKKCRKCHKICTWSKMTNEKVVEDSIFIILEVQNVPAYASIF